jgi:Glucose / Sorbosone dehydrogenase
MRRRALLAAVLLSMLAPASAAAAPSLVPVGTFAEPVHVAAPPGDATRLFVVERAGRVQVLAGGQKSLFLDATDVVGDSGSEEGLLSIAFAPDFATSGLYYVFYTDNAGDLVVREGSGGTLGRTLFTVAHPGQSNHNGGQLAFGPDGLLYAGTGDGGGQGDPEDDAQNPNSLLGKILRTDPRGAGAPQVWALGLRNPWRFSFDRQTGDVIIGDVGGSLNEEIDFAPAGTPAGRNYGWNDCEGSACSRTDTVPPAVNLPRSSGYTGVIGGFVVRDPGLPTLLGRYVFGDISKNTVMSVALGAETVPRAEATLPVSFPTSFGEDGLGRVYVALNGGAVYRIQDDAAPPPGVTPSAATDTVGCAVAARSPRRAQRILRRGKRLRVTLRANEDCMATVRAKRFRTKRNVALKADVARAVRLAPTKKGLRRMRRALARSDRGRLRLTVRISARDAAGNPTTARLRTRVR